MLRRYSRGGEIRIAYYRYDANGETFREYKQQKRSYNSRKITSEWPSLLRWHAIQAASFRHGACLKLGIAPAHTTTGR